MDVMSAREFGTNVAEEGLGGGELGVGVVGKGEVMKEMGEEGLGEKGKVVD